MPFLLNHPAFWHWLALGALLVVLEALAPGGLFLWLGIAAIAVGAVVFVVPGFTWQVQLIVFLVVAAITIAAGRRIPTVRERRSDAPLPGSRPERYVGRTFVLEDTTLNGRGKVGIGDTLWPVELEPAGSELFMGAHVTVVGVDGGTLIVVSAGEREPIGPPPEH